MRPLNSPTKNIEKYYANNFLLYKYDKIYEKDVFIVKPYISIIIGIIGTLSFAYTFKYFNFNEC